MSKQFMCKVSVCACTLILTACSGHTAYRNMPIVSGTSSSGSSASAASTSTASTTAVTRTFAGVATKMTANPQTKQVSPPVNHIKLSGSGLNNVVVDGHSVTLLETASATNSSNKGQVINDHYSYMRFGTYHVQEDGNLNSYVIAYGQLTPENRVPTAGIANYSGNSVYRENATSNNVHGISSFTVNYGTKQISGTVHNKFPLSGTISGNSFAGRHNNGLYMQGNFFGPNADELSGTFNNATDPNGATGTFGGRKQPQ